MNQTFTSNNLIRYAYNEADLLETALITLELENNVALANEYSEITNAMSFMDKALTGPSEKCMNNLLHYLHNSEEFVC